MLMFSLPRFFCATWITVMMMMVSLQMHGYRCCLQTERKGLLELKAYLNISEGLLELKDNINSSYFWPTDMNSDCCQWKAVNCDITSGRVIGLFINYAYTVPPLNLSLFYPFGELRTLNFSWIPCSYWYDDIYGYESLGRLKNLEILEFSSSGLDSSILPFLNAASSLRTLVLRGNSIEGTFPIKDLKELRNLEVLDLSRNRFSGPLPDLAYLHKLEALDLSDNSFSVSSETKGMIVHYRSNLRELDLSGNGLVGRLPLCFGSLTKLKVLDISSNKLNGTIPSLISNLTSLEYLSLSNNEFEGFFSFELIANLSKLKVFQTFI
ncbi:unnamed protein product [Eruca vesicaria subsp. sativa]|uniref:Leucine-rich repeat-containing N-terminal plant-type domain-containing protein n=1 Tax=Eruca vesicaria subsp. sativa TaxID=29727 RepID=A0ABC8L8P8_ERUVS|nr:unnamed protein product [Eruca vesicaria subsp. sativa]